MPKRDSKLQEVREASENGEPFHKADKTSQRASLVQLSDGNNSGFKVSADPPLKKDMGQCAKKRRGLLRANGGHNVRHERQQAKAS